MYSSHYGLAAQDDALLAEPWVERVIDIEDRERKRRSLERRLNRLSRSFCQSASIHVVTSMNRPDCYQPETIVAGRDSHPLERGAFHGARGSRANTEKSPCRSGRQLIEFFRDFGERDPLRVRAELDKRKYPTGVTATDAEMEALSLHRNEFHADWNYEVHPQ